MAYPGDLDVTNVNDDTDHHGEDAQDASTASSHNLVDKIVESSVDKQAATRNGKKSNLFELTLVTRNGRSMQIPDREMKKPASKYEINMSMKNVTIINLSPLN